MEVNSLTEAQAAYLAGLIDGEGTITLIRKHSNENRQLSLSISSTERPILDYVLNIVGAGKITRKRTQKQHHAPGFAFAIYNRQALDVLNQTHLYLKSYKAKRAELILSQYLKLTPRNGKYSAEQWNQRVTFEAQVLSIKAQSN